jgi:hypothetical protein
MKGFPTALYIYTMTDLAVYLPKDCTVYIKYLVTGVQHHYLLFGWCPSCFIFLLTVSPGLHAAAHF